MSKFKYIISCLMVLLMVFSLSACSVSVGRRKINLSKKGLSVSSEVSDRSVFFSSDKKKNLKKITSSGVLEMYLDEKTLAVCILDTISGKLWRSLPETDAGENTANLTADIIVSGGEYTLNSQSDSVAFNCADYEIQDGALTLSYSFRKSLENGKKIDLTVPIKLTLADGTLSAKVDCSNITDNSTAKVYLKSLSVLPFFGADNSGEKGDYILLPSASGIILDTYNPAKTFDEITLPVYGEDIAKNSEVLSCVPIGAFGMKKGSSAFVCLIDQGEAMANITAAKALKNGGYNCVSPEFEITTTLTDEKAIYLSKESYEGILSLSYRFLSGNNADYITMAGACRELLIRQGRLTDGNIDVSDNYPFNLTVVADTAKIGETTSQQETQELLTALISKGINNINIMLKGSEYGDLSQLTEFTAKENLSVALCRPLFEYSDRGALTLTGDRNTLGLSADRAAKKAEKTVDDMRKMGVGICLTDCGNILPSAYGGRDVLSRNDMLSTVSGLCTMLSSHGELTVSSANIYAVKYADNIINIPEKSPLEENKYCTSVPFLQAVLHGICDYSFTAVNLSEDSSAAILKAIEYGALPHYEWYFAQTEDSDPYHYMNSLSQARLVYENMKSMFSDLRDQRITSHEEVKTNVMCTVYSGGTEIYVNYNDKAVSVNGIILDPMGFMRVN